MKKIIALLLLACFCARAQQLTPGQSFVDGQRLTAAQLTALVSQATINPVFYSGQVQHNTNLQTTDILLLLTSGGVYQQMPGSGIITDSLFFTVPPNLTTAPGYGTMLYYNVSNNTITSIAISNLSLAIGSNLVISKFNYITNIIVGATNASSSNTNQPIAAPYPLTPNPLSTNNQTQFPVYDTNYLIGSLSFSNFLVAAAPYLGTNFSNSFGLVGYNFTNLWYSWLTYPTNTTTNAWGENTNRPITNLFFTNAVIPTNTPSIVNQQTLTNSDVFPLLTKSEGSNQPTTATLEALYEYLTNRNTLPAYAVARCIFNGQPHTVAVTNITVGGTNCLSATNHGMNALQAVCFAGTGNLSNQIGSTLIASNQVYWIQPFGVSTSNFLVFTNYNDAVAFNNPVVFNGGTISHNTVILAYVTNYTAFNADAIPVNSLGAASTNLSTGHYIMGFRTALTTTNYYVTGNVMENGAANFAGAMEVSNTNLVTTNALAVDTFDGGNPSGFVMKRVWVLVQPE